jgi:amino acid transporter
VAVGNPPSDDLVAGRDYGNLKRNSLGLSGGMAMSLAYISPTIGVIFISALIIGQAGIASPFAFILGTIGIGLMALTLAQFCRRIPATGTFYTFIARSFGSPVGFVAGWLLLLAYGLQAPLNLDLFGSFMHGLIQGDFGVNIPWGVFPVVLVVLIATLAWFSVHRSMQLDLILVAAEVLVVGSLLIFIVIKGGASGQAPQAFNPGLAPKGFSSIGLAFIFIIFAFFGFESSTTVAEEIKNPRRNVPIALVGSVVLTGLWFIFALYAVIVGYGPTHLAAAASSTSPIVYLAGRYLGSWDQTLVSLAAISANIAVLIAIFNANVRIIYALGRERLLHRRLGETHHKYMTPSFAIVTFAVVSAALAILFGLLWGPFGAFGFVGFWSGLAMIPIYIATNIGLFWFMKTRHPDQFSWFWFGLLPALAIAAFGGPLVSDLYPAPPEPEFAFAFITAAWIIVGVAWMLWLRHRNPKQVELIGQVIFQDEVPKLEENPFLAGTVQGGAD